MSNKLDERIAKRYNKIKNLGQYKDLTEAQLLAKAEESVLDVRDEMNISSLFTSKAEITLAKKFLEKYLHDYTPASVSDRNNLKHLIYLEIIQMRLQDKMNEMNDKSNAIPLTMIDSVHKNLREINDLKTKLGLIGAKRDEFKNDAYKTIDLLKDKFKRWRDENQGSRTLVCPYCGKMVMLKIRTEAWETQKHPFFRDRILANTHLMKLYNENKLTKNDVALVLECSENYIDWLVDRWQKIKDDKPMLMSEEKKIRENRCPECDSGFLSCRLAADGSERWEEHCTDCEYSKIHINRRQSQVKVDFPDRRKAPSSLQEEEQKNGQEENTEGHPGDRETTGAGESGQTDSQDKGSS